MCMLTEVMVESTGGGRAEGEDGDSGGEGREDLLVGMLELIKDSELGLKTGNGTEKKGEGERVS